MAKKAKQRMKQSLINFGRIWNASKATPDQKAAAAEHFGDGPGPADGHSDSSERRPRKMKGVGLLIILFVALLALLIYHRSTKKRSEDSIAKTEILDTISASRVAPMQKMKKQSVHPVQQEETTTVSEPGQKQQEAAPEPEPEKPTDTEPEPEYAPNGEVLIQMPVYPENGFDSYQEREKYFNTIKEYWEQQRRISIWVTQNHND